MIRETIARTELDDQNILNEKKLKKKTIIYKHGCLTTTKTHIKETTISLEVC